MFACRTVPSFGRNNSTPRFSVFFSTLKVFRREGFRGAISLGRTLVRPCSVISWSSIQVETRYSFTVMWSIPSPFHPIPIPPKKDPFVANRRVCLIKCWNFEILPLINLSYIVVSGFIPFFHMPWGPELANSNVNILKERDTQVFTSGCATCASARNARNLARKFSGAPWSPCVAWPIMPEAGLKCT